VFVKVKVEVFVGVLVAVQGVPGYPQGVLVAVGGTGVAVAAGEDGVLLPQAEIRAVRIPNRKIKLVSF